MFCWRAGFRVAGRPDAGTSCLLRLIMIMIMMTGNDDAGTTLATCKAMGCLRTSPSFWVRCARGSSKFSGGVGWHRDCARSRGFRNGLQGLTARRYCDGSNPHWPTLPRHSRCGGNLGECSLPQRAYRDSTHKLIFYFFSLMCPTHPSVHLGGEQFRCAEAHSAGSL